MSNFNEEKTANGNAVEDLIESNISKNAVIVVNAHFSTYSRDGQKSSKKKLPSSFILDLPERITMYEDKASQRYYDLIETFVYNTLSKKFQTDLWSCQIWLP